MLSVLSGHIRRVHYILLDMSEHQQCYGRRHLSYSVVGADIGHIRRSRWILSHASGHQQCCGRRRTALYPTAWATRLDSTRTLSFSHTLSCKAVPFIYKRGCALSKSDRSINERFETYDSNDSNRAHAQILSSRLSRPFGPEFDRTSCTPHLTPSCL